MRAGTKRMRALPLDDYIAWMLDQGYYAVDAKTGAVTNARTGRPLTTFLNGLGYPSVNLVYNRMVVRRALVHRMVAVKVWGVEAVRGKQVAHMDGARRRSIADNLWIPATARAHVYFDGTYKNLTRRKPKQQWPPCVRCGDSDGRITGGRATPDRITGGRFGIEGDICRRCYGALQERERRRRHSISSEGQPSANPAKI
jgi:hypothetical protein